ncbi:hypothetical protein CDAR_41631 [Caerostris darwini]|uniref:Uncharacterized protein n=1 Tax=Caerostris darwini TaxID=1538125 RepID=A0AAV4NE58_9ARAC|nr:hypothetical protein CDAR_41631 [Caerostris darwini]
MQSEQLCDEVRSRVARLGQTCILRVASSCSAFSESSEIFWNRGKPLRSQGDSTQKQRNRMHFTSDPLEEAAVVDECHWS